MNDPQQEWNLSCSPSELYTLASLLGADMLIGIPDPFPGWLTEEIQEAMEKALGSLTVRGVLFPGEEGRVVMDVVAAALVGTLAAPQAVFIVTCTRAGREPCQMNFYHRAPLTVAVEPADDQWTLRFLPDGGSIIREVQELWNLDHQPGVPSQPLSLPESVMEDIRSGRPDGADEILARLRAAGISGESAQALAHTLADARQNGALVALSIRHGVWNTGGLGMLEGENGLWMLRSFFRQQTPWIECVPRSAEQLMADVASLVRRFLPPQEG